MTKTQKNGKKERTSKTVHRISVSTSSNKNQKHKNPSHISILTDAYSAVQSFILKERLRKEAKDLRYIKKHIDSLIPGYVHAPTSGSKDVVIKPVKVSFG